MTLTRWSPMRDLAAVEVDVLNRMFESAFGGEQLAPAAWIPAVDIYETAEKDVVVKVDLPDMKRENIKLTFENNVLSIEGQRELTANVEHDRFHRLERGHQAAGRPAPAGGDAECRARSLPPPRTRPRPVPSELHAAGDGRRVTRGCELPGRRAHGEVAASR